MSDLEESSIISAKNYSRFFFMKNIEMLELFILFNPEIPNIRSGTDLHWDFKLGYALELCLCAMGGVS